MDKENRWILLEHINSPNDENKIHYDLLLEDGSACRTWRLDQIPRLDGQAVQANTAPLHKLEWLEKIESIVSEGRGFARRVEAGIFQGALPPSQNDPTTIKLLGRNLFGQLNITNGRCRIYSQKI